MSIWPLVGTSGLNISSDVNNHKTFCYLLRLMYEISQEGKWADYMNVSQKTELEIGKNKLR